MLSRTWLMIGLAAGAAGAAAAGARAQDGDEVSLFITAHAPGAQVRVWGEPALAMEQFLYPDDTLPIELAGPPAARQAVLNADAVATTIVLNAVDVELALGADGGLSVAAASSEPGAWIDVYHGADAPQVELRVGAATVRVPRAAVRAEHLGGDAWRISVANGAASVVAADGAEVAVQAGSAAEVDASGATGPAAPAALGLAQMTAAQSEITQASLLPDFVRVAEAVAEGDIEPPTRAARVEAAVVAPTVTIREVVPRGGTSLRVESRALVGVAGSRAQSTAEAFLASGEAALAVVGARLQRTRIIGAAAGGRALAINRELTPPFLLRPLRR